MAHWFAATVHVARGLLDQALNELRAGCALYDAQGASRGRFAATGLHWLHGLVLAATGSVDEALAELERELESADERHVYGRESLANSWYAIGALCLRQCKRDEAAAAFASALRYLPRHPLALLGHSVLEPGFGERVAPARAPAARTPGARRESRRQAPLGPAGSIDMATWRAAALALENDHERAASFCNDALKRANPGSAGWLLPVEPLLNASAHPDLWADALGTLADRAV